MSRAGKKNIAVVGTGYVGLIAAVVFAKFGHRVLCVDRDAEKIKKLRSGVVPFFEPGVRRLLRYGIARKLLAFTSDYGEIERLRPAIIFIAVGTPPRPNNSADLSMLKTAAVQLAKRLRHPTILVIKSTVPVGTAHRISAIIGRKTNVRADIVSNPEFLREGHALRDFLKPDKVLLGGGAHAVRALTELYRPLKAPVLTASHETVELAKYAQNAFLATEISFANTVAELAERCNADIRVIVQALKLDPRIGQNAYLAPGLGYGGSCLPKDVQALVRFAREAKHHPRFFEAVDAVNRARIASTAAKAEFLSGDLRGKRVALLGIAFKAGTDDIRSSPALETAKALAGAGARVIAYDPLVTTEAAVSRRKWLAIAKNPYEALRGSSLLILATEWPAFRKLDFARVRRLMRSPNVLDGRNFLPVEEMQRLGFNYMGVGLPYLKGLHFSWLKRLARDAKKLKRLSRHERRELESGLGHPRKLT